MFIVRSPSGVIRIIERAVGVPSVERRGREMDAERLHVVAEEAAELVVGDLADEGGAPAEGGDAGGGVAGAAAGDQLRRAHMAVEPVGLRAVDQPHRALHQALADEKILFRMRQHVDDRVADRQHVELRFGHLSPPVRTRPPSGSGRPLQTRPIGRRMSEQIGAAVGEVGIGGARGGEARRVVVGDDDRGGRMRSARAASVPSGMTMQERPA